MQGDCHIHTGAEALYEGPGDEGDLDFNVWLDEDAADGFTLCLEAVHRGHAVDCLFIPLRFCPVCGKQVEPW